MATEVKKPKIDSKKYRMRKKVKDRILEETKPGTILRNNPDYKAIMALVAKGE